MKLFPAQSTVFVWPAEDLEVIRLAKEIDDLISKAAAYHACEAWQRMYETQYEAKLKNDELRARLEELKKGAK